MKKFSSRAEYVCHFKERTKNFGIEIIRLAESMPKNTASFVIQKQLIRCATSVGSNYRAACRAKTGPDFIYKMSIVEEETDESIYWMEVAIGSGLTEAKNMEWAMKEAEELLKMTVASIRTAKAKEA
jgi:four helix bundle protein